MTDDELDHTPITRGQKHRGRTPDFVSQIDPAWLVWAYRNWNPKPCSKLLYDECCKDLAEDDRQERVTRDQDES